MMGRGLLSTDHGPLLGVIITDNFEHASLNIASGDCALHQGPDIEFTA